MWWGAPPQLYLPCATGHMAQDEALDVQVLATTQVHELGVDDEGNVGELTQDATTGRESCSWCGPLACNLQGTHSACVSRWGAHTRSSRGMTESMVCQPPAR